MNNTVSDERIRALACEYAGAYLEKGRLKNGYIDSADVDDEFLKFARALLALKAEQPAAQVVPVAWVDPVVRLMTHIEDVVSDSEWEKIDVGLWNAVANLTYRHPSPAAQVPEGWQLVPIEPTPEMLQEGLNRKARSLWADGRTPFRPSTANLRPAQEVAAIQWAAMLSASPKPPEPTAQAEKGGAL